MNSNSTKGTVTRSSGEPIKERDLYKSNEELVADYFASTELQTQFKNAPTYAIHVKGLRTFHERTAGARRLS